MVILMSMIWLIATPGAQAELSSSSYTIASYGISGAAAETTSPVFHLFASTSDQASSAELSSTSYSVAQGFTESIVVFTPILLSITPSSGFNTSPVSVTLAGTNFDANSTVYLTRTGEDNIPIRSLQLVSATELRGEFDLAGKKTGNWTVVVEDTSDETTSTLADGFEVKNYSYDMGIAINSPNPFDPARERTTIQYQLANNTDVTVVLFTTTADLIWKRTYASGSPGGSAGENSITWDGLSDFGELMSNGVYLFHVIDRGANKTVARGKIAIIRR